MKASFELSRVDFRTTPVENIFLDTYLSHAPADALRVYLAGWKACYSRSNEHVEETDLADLLGMSAEAVKDAVAYWVNEGLVVVDPDHPDRLTFRSMLLLWAGIGEPMPTASTTNLSKSDAPSIDGRQSGEQTTAKNENGVSTEQQSAEPQKVSASGNGLSQAEMFDALEEFLSEGLRYHVALKENELRLILQVMEHYAFTPDYFLYAYQSACQRNEVGSRSVNYVVAVIENWARFEQITDREALDAYFAKADREKTSRPTRRKRKQAAFAQKDNRMTREERKEWVNRKLEESRKRSLRGDGGASEKTLPLSTEELSDKSEGGEA
ncbi:DnaD domain-containing protein [Murdochiella massiliensis]|uniref:DnaD domain-containing protein n=1 Tax=Murdochiella massiliensis TaxID=1673723 RepID=UPI00082F496D|nr:DnaD domain protein [Murdochiella massiliensis]